MFESCSYVSRFRNLKMAVGKSTFGVWSSGASPGLIAGASDFPDGQEVLHDLNGRSWLPAFLAGCRGDFKFAMGSENYFFVIFVRCAFVRVFVICLSLVLGGSHCAGHKTAVYFWLCNGGCSLIVVLNACDFSIWTWPCGSNPERMFCRKWTC